MSNKYSPDSSISDESLNEGDDNLLAAAEVAIISPVPSAALSLPKTVEDTLLHLLTQPKFGNKDKKLDMILGILRECPENNFTGQALIQSKEMFFIHTKHSNAVLQRLWSTKDCAKWLLLLEPLLEASKKEWALLRTSNHDHANNRLAQHAT